MPKKKVTKEIASQLKKKTKKEVNPLSSKRILSTGSTLLNLACTDKFKGGFTKGKYFFIVGDSSSGKTFLTLTCLAEASINDNFKNYRFIYDNGEDGALMDIEKFFGKGVANRLEPPAGTKDNPEYSRTVEDFYYNVDDALQIAKEEDQPFIYVLDSENSLTSDAELEKFDEEKEAHRKGKDITGSYGDGKAKKHSSHMRKIITPLSKTGSILIVLSQTRDNLGFGHEKKTRSGGRALKFYACLEMWSSVSKKITKTVKGKKRQIGVNTTIKIKKNRLTGKEREITVPIYYSVGFDDVGSCVDYLIEEKHWPLKKKTVIADEIKFEGSRDAVINHIEENDLEDVVRSTVGEVWKEIEEACSVKRKKRYE